MCATVHESGRTAETYFPVRPTGTKKLDRTIELLFEGLAAQA